MNTVQILFSADSSWASKVTRFFLNSRWSHVVIIDPTTKTRIEAYPLQGVRERPLAVDALPTHKYTEFAIVNIPHPNPQAVFDMARTQLGKPYDLLGALGVGINRDWQEDDKWFCSEFVAWAFEKTGSSLFRSEAVKRISPQDLWELPFPVSLKSF
jgi:cell wall-associated NlpC family hydrolase